MFIPKLHISSFKICCTVVILNAIQWIDSYIFTSHNDTIYMKPFTELSRHSWGEGKTSVLPPPDQSND